MNHISLFNGIGGFQLAAEWMGWENTASCEIDKWCNKITIYHFPNCIQHEDIRKTDFTIYKERIDVLTGGFPCQPFSVAGKQLGTEDERHLWPEMLRAIWEIRLRWVVGENVRGIISWNGGMVFEQVCADLETEGYEVQPFLLPAVAVNAPHRRDRIWFVAHSDKFGCNNEQKESGQSVCNEKQYDSVYGQEWGKQQCGTCELDKVFADSSNAGTEGLQREWKNGIYRFGIDSDTNGASMEGCEKEGNIRGCGQNEHKQPSRLFRTDWENFPTQSPVCSRDDGLSERLDGITFSKWRKESIKGFGNAIVPKVALQIFKTINEYENGNRTY